MFPNFEFEQSAFDVVNFITEPVEKQKHKTYDALVYSKSKNDFFSLEIEYSNLAILKNFRHRYGRIVDLDVIVSLGEGNRLIIKSGDVYAKATQELLEVFKQNVNLWKAKERDNENVTVSGK